MTTITLPRATVEQALEAMRCAVPTGKITLADWLKAESDLRAALAQQPEPVDTDCHTQGICQRSGYGIGKQTDPQVADRLARHGTNPCPDCRGLGYDASGQLCWCQQNPSF